MRMFITFFPRACFAELRLPSQMQVSVITARKGRLGHHGVMTTELDLSAALRDGSEESLSPAQREALQRGVAKIVALGEQVGVSADQMAGLLKQGLSVRELLEYLEARSREGS
jgi:DNA-binding transcriptional regulator YhcF (GntR family)